MINIKQTLLNIINNVTERNSSYVIAALLLFRLVNLALAYTLIIVVSKTFSDSEYILFEKITFFLMAGNILLSPFIIAMWHERFVKQFVTEGLILLITISLFVSLALLITDHDMVIAVVASSALYFFCYYLKTTLYTHLITLKRYYSAYGSNTLFYSVYILGIGVFTYGFYFKSYLVSFLFLPSIILIVIFLVKWKALLNKEGEAPEKFRMKLGDIFSVILLMHNITTLLLASGERIILERYSVAGEEQLAAFLYLATIVSAFQSIGLSISEWLRPQIFERMANGDRLVGLYKKAVFLLVTIFIVFVAAGWPILNYISADKVALFSFYPFFIILSASQLLLVLTFIIDLQIVYRKKYILLLTASSLGLVGKIIGYWVWDGFGSLSGVVFANVLGASVFFISTALFICLMRSSTQRRLPQSMED